MTEPLSLDVILAEFDDNSEAWVLQDETSKQYVVIPHNKYPGRRPIHFFLRKEDAEALLMELNEENWYLKNKNIFPVKVKLIPAIKVIAADKNPDNADAFVVHSPNEVYEYIRARE